MQIPEDGAVGRGSDTPRNAPFTFIVLSLPGSSANAPGAPSRVTIGVVDTPETLLEVAMIRRDDRWIFAASTVEGVSAMARAIDVWWVTALPEFLVNVRIAEIELWQWAGLIAIGAVGLVLGMRLAQPVLVLSAPARENLSLGSRAALIFVVAMAHFTGFGDSAPTIEFRATFQTLDMPAYRAAVPRLNADLMRIVARHGSGFAFPSRTVYMAQDTGIAAGAGADEVTGAVRGLSSAHAS